MPTSVWALRGLALVCGCLGAAGSALPCSRAEWALWVDETCTHAGDTTACDWRSTCTHDALGGTVASISHGQTVQGEGSSGVVYLCTADASAQLAGGVHFETWQNSVHTISVRSNASGGGGGAGHAGYGTAVLVSVLGAVSMVSTRPPLMTGALGDCLAQSAGTGYSTAVISGLVALMLDALSGRVTASGHNLVRYVQEILVRTSTTIDGASWMVNGAGLKYDDHYGFGFVDADAAMEGAQTWPPENATLHAMMAKTSLWGGPGANSITVDAADALYFHSVEHVVVYLSASGDVNHTDFQVSLTSPAGTHGLVAGPLVQRWNNHTHLKYLALSTWGESAVGTWSIGVTGNAYVSWTIAIHGKCLSSSEALCTSVAQPRELPPYCTSDCPRSGDGLCDDGGPGASSSSCTFGSDCGDCHPDLWASSVPGAGAQTTVGSWADFQFHVGLCFTLWCALLLLGILFGSCRTSWDGDRVERILNPKIQIFRNRYYLLLSAAMAVLVCVLHVQHSQEGGTVEAHWGYVEVAACVLQLCEALSFWFYTTAKSTDECTRYTFGWLAVHCFMAPSVLVRALKLNQSSGFSFSSIASLRALQIWRYASSNMPSRQTVWFQLLDSSFTLLSAILCIANLTQQVETLHGEEWSFTSGLGYVPETEPAAMYWSMFSCVYFFTMSISTVGYGSPRVRTITAQCAVSVFTVLGIWLLLRTGLGVLMALDDAAGGGGQYRGSVRSKHIVVVGEPSAQVLQDFIREVYHEDHAQDFDDLYLVIMLMPGQRLLMHSMRQFQAKKENQRFRKRVIMIQGSALIHEDLRRVRYAEAAQGFLLPNIYATDPERDDHENIMRALSMHRHVPHVRIVTLLHKSANKDLLLAVGMVRGDILCIDELKHGLLGKSCEVTGFVALTCTLFKNTGGLEDHQEANSDKKPPWQDDYLRGLSNELYELDLSPAYSGAPFGEVALDIMTRSEGGAYLIGVVEKPTYPRDETRTLMFPGRFHKISNHEDRQNQGIFIAHCREAVRQYPPGGMFPWHFDPEMLESGTSDANQGALNLPHMVPDGVAGKESEGWVREPRDIKKEKDDALLASIREAAAQRATLSIRQQTKLPRGVIQEMLGVQHLALTEEELVEDPAKKRQMEREKEARLKDAAMVKAENEARLDAKIMAAAQGWVRMAEDEEDSEIRKREPDEKQKEDDLALWGSYPARPPAHWCSPKQPPSALLLRGGHVLLVALEANPISATPQNSHAMATGANILPPGRRLGLLHFIRSLRKGHGFLRSVVVVSNKVPYDWASTAGEAGVYLVLGDPLGAQSLIRAGVQQAHVAVIHQRCAAMANDTSTVDAEAIFACRLVESLVASKGRDIAVICDLMLEQNSSFVPQIMGTSADKRRSRPELEAIPNEEEDTEKKIDIDERAALPFYMQVRFICGQLFVSGVMTSLTANMFYNPALGSIFYEMIQAGYTIVPVPDDWGGHTYAELVTHFVTTRNMLPLALIRRMDVELAEDEDDEHEHEHGEGEGDRAVSAEGAARPAAVPLPPKHGAGPQRWSPQDPPSNRFVYTMPQGSRRVVEHDGVLCIRPTVSRGRKSLLASMLPPEPDAMAALPPPPL